MRDKSYVYLLKVSSDGIYKIGVAKDVKRRVKQLQTGNPEEIQILKTFHSQYPYKIESYLHRKYKRNNVLGECFYLSNEDINEFDETCKMCETNFEIMETWNNPYF